MAAVPPSAVSRQIGIETTYQPGAGAALGFLPQRIAVIGQGNTASTYPTTKAQVTSALSVGNTYGFGSPLYNAVKQLLPQNGDGVGTIPVTVYPLEDDGSAVASSGTITVAGTSQNNTATYYVSFNNILTVPITIPAGTVPNDAAALINTAIGASPEVPMTSGVATAVVTCTSKWAGASANGLNIEIIGDEDGLTFAVVQPTGGATNPDVQDALDQIGNVWETIIVNCMEIADTTALGLYQTFGDGRWLPSVHQPLVTFTGNTATTVAAATAVSDARKTDKVNSQLVEPGGVDLPHVVAARQVARIAKIANENPARDYGGQSATGLTPGADGDQWDLLQKEEAVTKGSSTIDSVDGVVRLSDTVSFYHPTGDPLPAYRFVVDQVKLQNVIYVINNLLNDPRLNGAPLIPDDQPTTNPDAVKPKDIKALIWSGLDFLGEKAIISDQETSKQNVTVAISQVNPKRLDIVIPVNVSGNVNIQSVEILWGFYFGSPVAA